MRYEDDTPCANCGFIPQRGPGWLVQGRCRACYTWWWRRGEERPAFPTKRTCRKERCGNRPHARGLCKRHYYYATIEEHRERARLTARRRRTQQSVAP